MTTSTSLVPVPTFSGTIERDVLVEPLQGSRQIARYLRSFPEEVYNLAPESHLVKFLSVLLGANGSNWILQNYLQARIALEELGVQNFDLDQFYGNPFQFGRILEENFEEDLGTLVDNAAARQIAAQDASYRARAFEFVAGARAGTTPLGMRLAARSALGHDVDIVENYKFYFDGHSDLRVGYTERGSTASMQEFVVIPRQDVALNLTQRIFVNFNVSLGISGTFIINYNGENTVPLAPIVDPDTLRLALEALKQIHQGDIAVFGGPDSTVPSENYHWDVVFQNKLGDRDVPVMTVQSSLSAGTEIGVEALLGAVETNRYISQIPPRDQHYLEVALDRIRSVATIPTLARGRGRTSRTSWSQIQPSSEFTQVVRYVTGNQYVGWPATDSVHWITPNAEIEAPQFNNTAAHHYQNFHNISDILAYTDAGADDAPVDFANALINPSFHVGNFSRQQSALFPFLRGDNNIFVSYTPDKALADRPQPLTVTSSQVVNGDLIPVINRSYPIDYENLPGVPSVINTDTFWASQERGNGSDFLEIDLGFEQAVNFLTFEVSRKPIDITILYDASGVYPARRWIPINPVMPYYNQVFMGPDINQWVNSEFSFWNPNNSMVFTRFLRIEFSRRDNPFTDVGSLFPMSSLFPSPTLFGGTAAPWSIEVRNLRVGRNVS